MNQTYNVKAGSTLYTVPWGTPKQVASKVSGTEIKHLKQLNSNKLIKQRIFYGTVNGKSG